MISRVADHCFWLGRYLERAESTARVLAVTKNLSLDAGLPPERCWLPVVIVSGEQERFPADPEGGFDGEAVQRYMTWERENPTAIARSVGAVRDNVRSIREVVSREAWETVNEHWLWLESDAAQRAWDEDRDGFYRRVRDATQLCLGVVDGTMLHDEPLDFIWLGVMLERLSQTARVLDVHHHAVSDISSAYANESLHQSQSQSQSQGGSSHQVVETALWLSLLRACSGSEAYMKRHQGRVSPQSVAAFLFFELRFPRSVRFCAHAALTRLSHIRPAHERDLPGGRSLERLKALETWLSVRTSETTERANLHSALTHVVDEAHDVCDEISQELLGG